MTPVIPHTGWAPQTRAELRVGIVGCLKLSPTDCSKGPHGPIGSWDVSSVTDMSWIFVDANENPVPGANVFNGDLYDWDISFNGTEMSDNSVPADRFNGDLSEWDMSKVTDVNHMFYYVSSFNSDISKWDVSKVTNMEDMFYSASSFNGDISKWDVSKVTDMFGMFSSASSFNSDLFNWDVSRVTNMEDMFSGASSFNSDISEWDVSRVTTMEEMFSGAASFSQTLCGAWYTSTTSTDGMFTGSSGRICKTATSTSKNTTSIKPPKLTLTRNLSLPLNLDLTLLDVSLTPMLRCATTCALIISDITNPTNVYPTTKPLTEH